MLDYRRVYLFLRFDSGEIEELMLDPDRWDDMHSCIVRRYKVFMEHLTMLVVHFWPTKCEDVPVGYPVISLMFWCS